MTKSGTGTWGLGRGTRVWDVGRVGWDSGTWDVGRGTWDVGRGTWDVGTWGRGNVRTRRRGDVGTWDSGTWRFVNRIIFLWRKMTLFMAFRNE